MPLLFVFLVLFSALSGCKTAGQAGSLDSAISLDKAIEIAAHTIGSTLPEGTVVAVINFGSPAPELSDYVIEELMGRLIRDGKLVVVDRGNLELIRGEMDFQLSGEVSDESAQSIGKKLGAENIITGSLTSIGNNYRFRMYTLNVESAARKTATMETVHLAGGLESLASSGAQASPAVAPPAKTAAAVPASPPQAVSGDFVRIPGGVFMMGSPESEASRQDDEVLHQIAISPFLLKRHEVSQEEYEGVMGVNPSYAKGKNLPVEKVSWDDAIDFCNRLSELEKLTPVYTRSGDLIAWNAKAPGYRLPTEAEWEYACRAGTTGPFSTGDNITTHEANYNGYYPYNNNARGSYMRTTMPVGSYPPNPWGLYDMHGNVTEWCWDWYADYNTAPQTDPHGASGGRRGRIARGGSYSDGGSDQRSAVRFYGEPSFRLDQLGFRIVRQTP
ncbi:serine/threonine kinase [Leadbettera azotonutricia ZAS-9]|uniref:Serine/threonine kinase n=1 Tax=Leadbettera azotonutricia (strain ATCC BAA-888 / DSM 13862 / ZAS-9) TaxID=545695 RepID=F5YA68_LEAAZ|nr:serine/threonine kinase [Leadbettera azotonutricia ZAS-9]